MIAKKVRLVMESGSSNFAEMTGGLLKRLHSFTDGPMTRKKLKTLFLLVLAVILLLYIGTILMNDSASWQNDFLSEIVEMNFQNDLSHYDAYLRHENATILSSLRQNYVPYVGNGLLGLALEHDSNLNIKQGRTLSLPVRYHPLYIIQDQDMKEITVAEYKKGIINRFQCSNSGLQVSYQYYAHRTIPSLFVQEIWVNNSSNKTKNLHISTPRISDWPTAIKQTIKLHQEVNTKEYEVVTGMLEIPDSDNVRAVAVVCRKLDNTLQVDARDSLELVILTTVQYSKPVKRSDYAKHKYIVEVKAIAEMEKVISLTGDRAAMQNLKENHTRVWQELWYTGFYISDSKAQGIINGDRVNATIYSILSQVRSYEHGEKADILRTLSHSESCYSGHSTLDAFNLWKPINNIENLNNVANAWLLTLEKHGCHKLLKGGAIGVNQAMILSFGSLRFTNQHLEYNIHPSKLHRDLLFRRLYYGNMTHVTIGVTVRKEDKAVIFVVLDRLDNTYYGCGAGCSDGPDLLGPYRKYFPVKLTDPLTAILYITADRQDMEELKHANLYIEVTEASAHEHHAIALHKHGHSSGGLNPLFWISVIALIVVFHLFIL